MPAEAKARVMIVDDHPVVHEGLKAVLDVDPRFEVCGHAPSVREAAAMIDKLNPNVVVVDVTLPDGSGIELTRRLVEQDATRRVVIYSFHDEQLYAERAIRAGAAGYVMKSHDVKEIGTALARVLSGDLYLSERMTQRLVHDATGRTTAARKSSADLGRLTDRELEVFTMIGQGSTTSQIARELHISAKTVASHREHIKAKLGIPNANQLVRRAVEWVTTGGEAP